MALSIFALSLLSILAAAGIRYRELQFRHAAPFDLGPVVWWSLASLCLGVLAWQLFRSGRSRKPAGRGPWELSLVPMLLFLLWAWYPSGAPGPLHLAVAGALFALVASAALLDPRRARIWGTRREFTNALRILTLPTVILAALVIGLWLQYPREIRVDRLVLSLLSYPLYALLQLGLFYGLVVSRLEDLGARPRALVLTPSMLFSIAHWPNGWLMLATGLVGLMWAVVYRRHRSLPALAISMGILASAYVQLLPEQFTSHTRVGPGYVLKAHVFELYDQAAAETDRYASDAFFAEHGPDAEDYVRACFEQVLHRAPTDAEAADWADGWSQAWRAHIASAILIARRGEAVPEEQLRRDGEAWSAESLWNELGEDWRAWLARFFRAEVGRELRDEDLEHWSPQPGLYHRRALVRALQRTPFYSEVEGSPAWSCLRLGPWLPPPESFRPRWTGARPEFRLSQRITVNLPTKLRNEGSADSTE